MPESNSEITLRVKQGSTEVEIRCKKPDIGELLQIAEKYLQLLGKTSTTQDAVSRTDGKREDVSQEVPSIATRGLRESIRELLESDWGGFPRNANEIKEALEMNALHWPITTIASALNSLTKSGDLRRLKKDKVFSYVVAKKTDAK